MTTSNPTAVGRFLVDRVLSRRGPSTVFLATDPGSNKKVVVRVLRAETTADLKTRDRVLRRAEWSRQFQGPALVPMDEITRDKRELHLVRSFVEGSDLTRIAHGYRSRSIPFPELGAWTIAVDLLGALLELHQVRGGPESEPVAHGGLNPRNIFVSRDHQLRVTGYGFSDLGTRESTSVAEWYTNRMQFMSPGQVQGLPLDAGDDLFALGAILFSLLTEEDVYGLSHKELTPGGALQGVTEWQGADFNHPRLKVCSSGFVACIKKCLSPNPKDRFSSVDDASKAFGVVNPVGDASVRREVLGTLLTNQESRQLAEFRQEHSRNHPLGEGGATRTISETLDGNPRRAIDDDTLRGDVPPPFLGEDFESAKASFGDVKSILRPKSISGSDKPEGKVKLRASAPGLSQTGEYDQTLEISHSEAFGKSPRTIVRMRTPAPQNVVEQQGRREFSEGNLQVRIPENQRAVLANELPSLRNSGTFRLLVVALFVLFALIVILGLLLSTQPSVEQYEKSGGLTQSVHVAHVKADWERTDEDF